MSLVFCDSVETPLFVAAAAGNPWRKFSPLATTECAKSSPGGNFRSASLRCALPENLSTALNSAFFLPLTFCVTKLQITAPHRALSSGHQPWGPQSDDGGGFRHGFHHTHTHTRSLANFCAGSTQFFPFLCCFCAAFSFREPLFFSLPPRPSFSFWPHSQVTTDGHFFFTACHFFTGGFYLPAGPQPRRRNIHGSGPTFGATNSASSSTSTTGQPLLLLAERYTHTNTHTHTHVVVGKPLLGQLGNLPRKTEKNGPCLAHQIRNQV